MSTTFKELLTARNKAYNKMKQVNSVVCYLHDALEQAKSTGLQYNIDHARNRYTSYFDEYFYNSCNDYNEVNDSVINHLMCIDSRISKLLKESDHA